MEEAPRTSVVLDKENDDILGMDESIKLKTRAKVAKIDDERMFSRANGLEHIVKNYPKVLRVMKKNDDKLKRKLESTTGSSMRKRAKCQNEYENLGAILQFYQLWCHGLFPKSNFKECIRMVRVYGGKSPRMRLYRRELLDQQINKLREEKGIAIVATNAPVESSDQVFVEEGQSDVYAAESTSIAQPLATGVTVEDDDDDDDWSFMKRGNPKNALFIDEDDDELYDTPDSNLHRESEQNGQNGQIGQIEHTETQVQEGSKKADAESAENVPIVAAPTSTIIQTGDKITLTLADTVFSDFDDDAEEYPEEIDQQAAFNEINDDNDDQELELMREMGF